MVGPFKITLGSYTHIFMPIDKFTKWIEVKAVTSIESAKAAQFMEEITQRFGMPNRIITDLGKQFTASEFWYFCQDNLIDVYNSSIAHPCCNSQVVLPSVVAFGAPRILYYEEGEAETSWQVDIDSLEEYRVVALIQHAHHKQQIQIYHYRNVRECSFNVGNLVLHRIQSTKDMHKLAALWEGPFHCQRSHPAKHLSTRLGGQLRHPNSWNIKHLRRFYP
ncbi:uncharacterized protein LOC106804469 [Setaria italica]|uniref:uncharacterized protein LOC106804469 n=1 Tax=Setaria italica TaxID=4555 RepID=UPI0003511E12|nr:uncharacterized protein LOC106804469 [Setaria italica]XP_034569849.1 uncharacterized protein LOC117834360 [Setaria viridis]